MSCTDEAAAAADALRDLKKELRKQVRQEIQQYSAEQLNEESLAVWNRVQLLSLYQSASTVGVFLSMPQNEINSYPFIDELLKQEKKIYVPQVGADFEKSDMDLLLVSEPQLSSTSPVDGAELAKLVPFYQAWPRNKWGIPEPPKGDDSEIIAQPGDIDLLIVPGLAFDASGNRLGQGKGYYDRFISKMKAGTARRPALVGVCLQCQLLSGNDAQGGAIPMSQHDQPMDIVVTPNQVIHISPL
jgi:5-formyltetrahydrofolate cyclo-ligase